MCLNVHSNQILVPYKFDGCILIYVNWIKNYCHLQDQCRWLYNSSLSPTIVKKKCLITSDSVIK